MKTALLLAVLSAGIVSADLLVNNTEHYQESNETTGWNLTEHRDRHNRHQEEQEEYRHADLLRLIIIAVSIYILLLACTYCLRLCESRSEKFSRMNDYVKDDTVLEA